MKISILIPAYNESRTIIEILKKIHANKDKNIYEFEIIIINDGSTDDTEDKLIKNKHLYNELLSIKKNSGKGNALNLGFGKCTGEIIIIQDADLEYNPEDYPKLLSPFEKFDADIVYGSRFKSSDVNAVLLFWYTVANKIITLWFFNKYCDSWVPKYPPPPDINIVFILVLLLKLINLI
mgnify:CR=1 FL=1